MPGAGAVHHIRLGPQPMFAARPLRPWKQTFRTCLAMSQKCHKPTWPPVRVASASAPTMHIGGVPWSWINTDSLQVLLRASQGRIDGQRLTPIGLSPLKVPLLGVGVSALKVSPGFWLPLDNRVVVG